MHYACFRLRTRYCNVLVLFGFERNRTRSVTSRYYGNKISALQLWGVFAKEKKELGTEEEFCMCITLFVHSLAVVA